MSTAGPDLEGAEPPAPRVRGARGARAVQLLPSARVTELPPPPPPAASWDASSTLHPVSGASCRGRGGGPLLSRPGGRCGGPGRDSGDPMCPQQCCGLRWADLPALPGPVPAAQPSLTASPQTEELFDLIASSQSRRLDDQRASLGRLPGLRVTHNNLGHLRGDRDPQAPGDEFFNMLIKCQVCAAGGGGGGCPAPGPLQGLCPPLRPGLGKPWGVGAGRGRGG